MKILLGFILALLITWAAKTKKSLNRSGAAAALLMGTIIFGIGGLSWAALLLVFFISSSILSRIKKNAKLIFDEKFSKTAERDAFQVFANGGLAMLLVSIHTIQPENNWTWLLFAASLAAANADTWATELGVLSKTTPRLITTQRVVEPGTSGAISLVGLLASAAGAAFIALPAVLLWQGNLPPAGFLGRFFLFGAITLAGFAASLFDSLLGATIQAIYYCPHCRKETEQFPNHTCHTATTPLRGLAWLNNDWVNFSATVIGTLSALLLAGIISQTIWFSMNGRISNLPLNITSPAFENNTEIPVQYTCEGNNQPFEIQWSELPENTQAILISMQDADTPIGRISHWLATANINKTDTSNLSIHHWVYGANYSNNAAYTGPCPPPGRAHRYYTRVYTLSQPLQLPSGFSWSMAVDAMQTNVIAEGWLMGKY